MSAGGGGEDAVPHLKTRLLAHVAGLDRGFAATRRQVRFNVHTHVAHYKTMDNSSCRRQRLWVYTT